MPLRLDDRAAVRKLGVVVSRRGAHGSMRRQGVPVLGRDATSAFSIAAGLLFGGRGSMVKAFVAAAQAAAVFRRGEEFAAHGGQVGVAATCAGLSPRLEQGARPGCGDPPAARRSACRPTCT